MASVVGSLALGASPTLFAFYRLVKFCIAARRSSAEFLKGSGEALVLGSKLCFHHRGAFVGGVPKGQASHVDGAALVRLHVRQFHLDLFQLLLQRLKADGEDVGRGVRVHFFKAEGKNMRLAALNRLLPFLLPCGRSQRSYAPYS